MKGKYTIEYDGKSAEIDVYAGMNTPYGIGQNKITLHYTFDDYEVEQIMRDIANTSNCLQSYNHKLGSSLIKWDGELEILESGFNQYFKSHVYTGLRAQLLYGNKVVTTGPLKGYSIEHIPFKTTITSSTPTCDCGAVKCGYADEPSPNHSNWCELMQGDLPA